jgi:hypothetical protein
MIFKTQVGVKWECITNYPEVFDNSLGKYMRISMIRRRTLLISNMDLTGISGWPTHEGIETNCRKVKSG